MKPQKEKREAKRVEVDGELLLDIHSEGFIKTDTVNISSSGINFLSSAAMPLFRELEIKLTLPNKHKNRNINEIRCCGVVVRCEKKNDKWFDISLFFTGLTKEGRTIIDEYVDVESSVKRLLK